jgi:penicillin-binding protein A
MRDIKHIIEKKPIFGRKSPRNNSTANLCSKLTETKQKKARLKVALPVVAMILAAYPLISVFVSAKNAVSSVVAPKKMDSSELFRLGAESLPASQFDDGRLVATLPDGGKILYGIDEELQTRVSKVLEDNRVPYGAFVALEPKTGRILAMKGHSSIDPSWERQSVYGLYPMASLFKIITATAALELNKVTPDTLVSFRGRLTSENPRYWEVRGGRHDQQMPLSLAMGKSVNPVFGRLASEFAGKDSIVACTERYGFNQIIFPTPAMPSTSIVPQTDAELQRMGAGLCKDVKISPLHAASMIAAIANDGVMMQPVLAHELRNSKGELVYAETPHEVRRIVAPETAHELTKMLTTTVSAGTSRRAFQVWRGQPKLAAIQVAAKTGSINGTSPAGHYSWFVAYAPVDDPQIAVAALIVNQDKWRIKASHVGEQALEAFFK